MKTVFSLILIIIFTYSFEVFAFDYNVDVYGTDEQTSNEVLKKFGKEINSYSECYLLENRKKPACYPSKTKIIKQKIIKKIKKKYNFAYADISTVLYHDGTVFSTIDVIEKNDCKRIAYLNNFDSLKLNNNIKISKDLGKLIVHWDEYMEKVQDLFLKKELSFVKKCPAYHCLSDFEHVDLKKYQAIFDEEAPKQKNKLIEILKTDPDEKHRAASVFLLVHIKEGNELIEILVPSLRDPSKTVRNNVMRVLGSTLDIVRPDNFNIDPIILALDSPVLTDRNKALSIMISLGSKPEHANYIAKNARLLLIRLLKMKQPNLHSNAYGVLVSISHNSYGEYDYTIWNKWLLEQAKK